MSETSDTKPSPQATISSRRVEAAVTRWQEDLLDLSKVNKLIHFDPRRHGLAVSHPTPTSLFDTLVNRSRSYKVYQAEDNAVDGEAGTRDDALALVLSSAPLEVDGDEDSAPSLPVVPPGKSEIAFSGDPKKVNAWLNRFRLKARTALQEQGVGVLFLAFGTLEMREAAASEVPVLSPLILVPVRLDRETALAQYQLAPLDEPPVVNPALGHKLKQEFGLNLELPPVGDDDPDLDLYLSHIRGIVGTARGWIVSDDVHLGLFSFAKHAMYADLRARREDLMGNPLVRAISGEDIDISLPGVDIPTAEELDDTVKPAEVFQVLDADASQMEAIAAVKAGMNLVIQGPPGRASRRRSRILSPRRSRKRRPFYSSAKRWLRSRSWHAASPPPGWATSVSNCTVKTPPRQP